jgi:hypothetical protein
MLQEIMGHASITITLELHGNLYPGEMDRYADRLGEAATNGDAAKMRPRHAAECRWRALTVIVAVTAAVSSPDPAA